MCVCVCVCERKRELPSATVTTQLLAYSRRDGLLSDAQHDWVSACECVSGSVCVHVRVYPVCVCVWRRGEGQNGRMRSEVFRVKMGESHVEQKGREKKQKTKKKTMSAGEQL